MRRLLPLVLAITMGVPAIAEDSGLQPPDVQGITANVTTRTNVRYGPSANARIVCTLDAGDAIEILGPAEVPEWYVIRFPQKGQAWVDGKNLQPLDGGKRWKVMTDGTRARDDATLKGGIVAELAKDEVIEDRNSARGNWHAVYIPSAVAYVSKKLVTLPNPQAIQQQQAAQQKAAALWDSAQAEYRRLYQQLQTQPDSAADVDWSPLLGQLDDVAKTHGNSQVRLTAQRIHDGIAAVAQKAKDYREAHGTTKPPTTVASATTGGGTTGGGTTGGGTSDPGKVVKIDTGEKPLQVPEGTGDQPQAQPKTQQPLPTPQAPAASFTAVGFIVENTDYPKVNAPNLVLDGNSKVVAFLTPKVGSPVNLGEFIWRWVGVAGEQKDLDPALHGLGTKVPLIEVDSVQLQKK
jgi:hypothetical protein